MRVGVDIDITLVETGVEWWKWLKMYDNRSTQTHIQKEYKRWKVKFDYDLSVYFPTFEYQSSRRPHDFWKQGNLYNGLPPLPNSVNVIKGWQMLDTRLCS